jgi:hypothetical protein
MSEFDPRSRFFMSDYQQTSLAINPSVDDSMDTNQVTTNTPPNFIQEMQGGNTSLSQARSRDSLHSAPSATSDRYAAWGSSDSSAVGYGLSVIGRDTDIPATTASFAFPGQFQSWPKQQPLTSDDWSAGSDYRFPFLLIQDGSPVRSVEVFRVQ